ncbi:unnamed protein product [Rhizoctonia solani]|uniref:DUF4939 domain-containing protein n=1 Tax=Rhizoctonia solani TaxID=456999 RepID=A0A8H3GH92_9AGAM|nr:unnamed protein product [Rhizoctonia solani]
MEPSSRPTSCTGQHTSQGLQGVPTQLHKAPTSLNEIHTLLIGLQFQIAALNKKFQEKIKDIQTMVEEVNQIVARAPREDEQPNTPEQTKPAQTDVEQTPQAFIGLPKTVSIEDTKPNTSRRTCWDSSSSTEEKSTLTWPVSISATSSHPCTMPGSLRGLTPSTNIGTTPSIQVKAPDPFKGIIGSKAKQWMAQVVGWMKLNWGQFAREEDVIMYFLINMEGPAATWALPHMAMFGTNKATINNID